MRTMLAAIALTLFGLLSADPVTGETDYSFEGLMVAIDDGTDDRVLLVPLKHDEANRIDSPCSPNLRRTRYE